MENPSSNGEHPQRDSSEARVGLAIAVHRGDDVEEAFGEPEGPKPGKEESVSKGGEGGSKVP